MEDRSIKELLELMLSRQDLFTKGLCDWVSDLHYDEIINMYEYIKLKNYISNNKPITFHIILSSNTSAFYWKKGNIKPRIKWVNKHIKKLSK